MLRYDSESPAAGVPRGGVEATVGMAMSASARSALRVVGLYLLAAVLWILLSDRVAAALFPEAANLAYVQTVKGLAFIGATGVLLWVLIRRQLLRLEAELAARRASEAAVRASEEKFRSYVDRAPMGVLITDGAGRYVDANPEACRLLGYSREELLTRTVPSVIAPEGAAAGEEHFRRVLTEGYAEGDVPLVRGDGTMFWANVVAVRLGPDRFIGFQTDITAAREAAEALRRSREQYRSVFRAVRDCLLISDFEGVVLEANPAAVAAFGPYTYDEARLHLRDLFPPAQQSRLYNLLAQVQRDGVHQANLICRHRDGTEFPGEVVGVLAEHQGRVQMLLGIRDITDRVAAEQARNELYERLDKIASLVPGVVYQFKRPAHGPDCFPYASEGIREIFRLSPAEVALSADKAFATVHRDDEPRLRRSIDESARSLLQWRCEFRTQFLDGTVRWLSGQANPRREPDGAILWHGHITDITELKDAEEARRQMEAQLHQARRLEAIGQLAGGVAHDFNNMLQIVTSCAEMALSRLEPGSALHADVLQIRTAANRSADLTRQLLAFSRRQPVEPQPVALNEALAGQLRLLRRLIGENIDLQSSPQADPCLILIDPSQLDQLVANLVVNARDAIAGTGVIRVSTANATLGADAPEVVAGEVPAGEHILLQVADSGVGMDGETMVRIFEPFFTTKELGRGTGLGLATVYGIVRQNGGGIHVDSTVGRGTTFFVYLPRHRGTITVAGGPVPPPPPPRGSETILVTEDEPAIRGLVAEILRRQGYQVLVACQAEDALRLAREAVDPIHLLLTDVVMPQMNGRELMTRVTALQPGIRTLFMSGYTSDIIAAEGTIDQDLNFLQKPFTAGQLAAKVREVLGASSA